MIAVLAKCMTPYAHLVARTRRSPSNPGAIALSTVAIATNSAALRRSEGDTKVSGGWNPSPLTILCNENLVTFDKCL